MAADNRGALLAAEVTDRQSMLWRKPHVAAAGITRQVRGC